MSQQVQLRAEHVAVVQAYERLQALMGVEAAQLLAWQQEGAAKELRDMMGKLDSLKRQLVRDAQRLLVVPQVQVTT